MKIRCSIPARCVLGALLVAACVVPGDDALARGPWRASEGNTPGWALMTPEERIEHQARIRGLKSYKECLTFRRAHREQMDARARAQGRRLGAGHRNFCDQLFPDEAPD